MIGLRSIPMESFACILSYVEWSPEQFEAMRRGRGDIFNRESSAETGSIYGELRYGSIEMEVRLRSVLDSRGEQISIHMRSRSRKPILDIFMWMRSLLPRFQVIFSLSDHAANDDLIINASSDGFDMSLSSISSPLAVCLPKLPGMGLLMPSPMGSSILDEMEHVMLDVVDRAHPFDQITLYASIDTDMSKLMAYELFIWSHVAGDLRVSIHPSVLSITLFGGVAEARVHIDRLRDGHPIDKSTIWRRSRIEEGYRHIDHEARDGPIILEIDQTCQILSENFM